MTTKFADQWPDVIAETTADEFHLHVRGRSMHPTLRPEDEIRVSKTTAETLRRGDWIVIRAPSGPLIHRFLGFARDGRLLTKGDAHRAPDPLWPREALLGRVTAVTRRGVTTAVQADSPGERIKTMLHRVIASIWGWRRSRQTKTLRILLPAILVLALAPHPLYAAVTLAEFGAVARTADIRVYWETASEVNMSVFYVLRGLSTTGTFTRISDFIPADGDLGGALYEYLDTNVVAGTTYYYQLEAVETNGSSEFHGPVSARIPLPGENETPTPSPTPTITPTPTPQPAQPTATPAPFVRFWADQTTIQAGQCVTLQWETREISAVFLDGVGVPGVSGRTVCPCENQIYTLRVSYRDGSSQDFTVALSVQGVCTPAPPGSTATPTFPPPPTITPRPEETLQPPVDNASPATPRREPDAPTATQSLQPPTESTPSPSNGTPSIAETAFPTPTLARPALGGNEGRPASPSGWLWAGIGMGGLLILAGGLGVWWIRKRA